MPLARWYNIAVWRDDEGVLVLVRSIANVSENVVVVDLEDGREHVWRIDTVLGGGDGGGGGGGSSSVGLTIPGQEWGFTTRPLCDLVPTQVTVPATALTGDTFSITWTVENRGRAGPVVASWTDAVYLSEQRVLDPRAPGTFYVGSFRSLRYVVGIVLLPASSL